MTNSFDIQDADTINSLIIICKLNLKANQALDMGDYEGFTKLSRELGNQRKLANFAAAQRKKEEKNDFVDSVGELVAYCEKNGGQIPRFELDEPVRNSSNRENVTEIPSHERLDLYAKKDSLKDINIFCYSANEYLICGTINNS